MLAIAANLPTSQPRYLSYSGSTFREIKSNQINVQEVHLVGLEQSRTLITSNQLDTLACAVLSYTQQLAYLCLHDVRVCHVPVVVPN